MHSQFLLFSGGENGIINTGSPLDLISQQFIWHVKTACWWVVFTLMAVKELTQFNDWGALLTMIHRCRQTFFILSQLHLMILKSVMCSNASLKLIFTIKTTATLWSHKQHMVLVISMEKFEQNYQVKCLYIPFKILILFWKIV